MMTTHEKAMARIYNKNSAAHVYALGFVFERKLYVSKLSWRELYAFMVGDHASSARGGYSKIRIRMSADARRELSKTAELLGPAELLTKDPKYNRGENLEREITERWTGEAWVKDSVPFFVKGDINVDGVEIQIKLDSAELTNEKILKKFGLK